MDKMLIISLLLGAVLIVWELVFPKRKFSRKLKLQSYLADGLIAVSNNLLFLIFSIGSLYYLSENFFSLKLLSKFDYDNPFILFGAIVFLDLMVYFWHFLNHKIPFLWMFHKAHHTEIYLNAVSGLRFHVGELLLSVLFKSFFLIIILGIPIKVILLSEGIVIMFSMFQHANISFKGEKILSKLIVVPYLHQMHHAVGRKEHDSNYGVIFSLWDRMFRTLIDRENKLIGLGKIKFQNFRKFLAFGFRYRY